MRQRVAEATSPETSKTVGSSHQELGEADAPLEDPGLTLAQLTFVPSPVRGDVFVVSGLLVCFWLVSLMGKSGLHI